MKEIQFSAPDELKRDDLLKLFEQELDEFSIFMAELGDARVSGPLMKSERAILKSYLVHKFRGRLNGGVDGKTEGGAVPMRPVQEGASSSNPTGGQGA